MSDTTPPPPPDGGFTPPPPPPGYGAPGYGAPGYGAPGYGPPPPGMPYGAPGGYGGAPVQNQKALWSMILGIVGLLCCVIGGIVAIIIGGQAKAEIAGSGGTQTGEGMAKAGVIMGWISIGLTILGIVAYIAIFAIAGVSSSTTGY